MRHAGITALDTLEPLLARLRGLNGLTEKGRGVFYRKSRAFLHFHEDPSGLYADVRCAGDDFLRYRVDAEGEQAALIETIRATLGVEVSRRLAAEAR